MYYLHVAATLLLLLLLPLLIVLFLQVTFTVANVISFCVSMLLSLKVRHFNTQ